ncbi:MAG: carbohydrate ABC transporter permease [Chloroflexaceae bacterium]|nr:carbohydrate ABC transporter permease [Chloroflexaceae bacterium]
MAQKETTAPLYTTTRSRVQFWQRRNMLPTLLSYAGMLCILVVIGLPIYWMIIASLKTNQEIYTIPPTWFPRELTFANYPEAWSAAPFGRYYLNSMLTTVIGSGFEIFFAVTSAYALVFLRFPRKQVIFIILLAALMIPPEITIVPNYITVARLGWVNTYQGIMITGIAIAYGTFLLRQYFLTLPREVIEAAKVDGAGHLQTLWYIVLPIAQPALVTMALISIVYKWNEFLWPLIVTNTTDMRTLPIGIFWLLDQEGVTNWGVVMAGTLFVIAPIVVIFIWAQKYIVEGIAAGAVKE